VRATFLIGPAGTGKTHRCLAAVRESLQRSPEGPPLLFLAPKQATYQIERELLSDADLQGYARLQVLSFERLANLVLAASLPSRVLRVEGRVMVLRALLTRCQDQLKVFRGSARLPGFARQISDCITEFQNHHVTPAGLLAAAEKLENNISLANKLRDLALIFSFYIAWLKREGLHDASALLDLAADAVRRGAQTGRFRWEALWLDGFAELTPQEMALLLAIIPACERATLAFCADAIEARERDWLSTWAIAESSAAQCCEAVRALPECIVTVDHLQRGTKHSRFSGAPVLAHVEAGWESASPSATTGQDLSRSLRVAVCANPEAEAALAAQEILRHARAGGRFRECGVIVRDLSGYHSAIRRVFTRYEIPFFIDRREPVVHHPLPELTRSALRLAAFDWQLDDWLSVLKTGLVTTDDSEIDVLENEALERGWSGRIWQQPRCGLDSGHRADALEQLRQHIVPPFAQFTEALRRPSSGPSGHEFAGVLQQLWDELRIPQTLETWSAGDGDSQPAAVHSAIWEQMQDWLADLALAFGDQRLDLREWLSVVDAGLSSFTVGLVPPALDQVLVGTVDRSRNPNLELAIVLGLNETIFPAPPGRPVLLTENERATLQDASVRLGFPNAARVGHEHYYCYIACTRPRCRLVLSHSTCDLMEQKLNPSIFISRVRRMFPALQVEQWQRTENWLEAEHATDVLPALMAQNGQLPVSSPFAPLRERMASWRALSMTDSLSPVAAERLYGRALSTSVTSLQRFGECPFKFLVHSGLRAQERRLFQVDRRKLGDFQHRVLKAFHDQLQTEGRQWRDLTPLDARRRIARIAEDHARTYHHGLFAASARQHFSAGQLSLALQDFIEVIVGWMRQYSFDPVAAELRFGADGDLPPWRLPLSKGRSLVFNGSIDRVDILKQQDGTALCVVLDFKSSQHSIDPVLLHNGVQLQLPAYLNALRRMEDPHARFGVFELKPVGLFYVTLRGYYKSGRLRDEVLRDRDSARRKAYRHVGHFDLSALPLLDSENAADQFRYSLKKDGAVGRRSKDPMGSAEFIALLDAVEERLRDFGERIFAGEAGVAPYRKGADVPCRFCDYRPICRIDPWTHQYRSLEAPPS
jgi:ATP-dependent helicase/nuclease subunit B